MRTSSQGGLMILLLLVCYLGNTWACTCIPTHAQQQFCRAQIVLVATVKDVEEIYQNSLIKAPNPLDPDDPFALMPVEKKFKVRIHRFFKGKKLLNGLGKNLKYVHTSGSGAACGVILSKGKTYLLTGRLLRTNEVWTSMCDWIQSYKTINRHQMKGLKFHYGRNCNCEVTWCQDMYCNGGNADQCEWTPRFWNQDCFQDHGFCMKGNKSRCGWKKNKQLRKCLYTTNQVPPWKTARQYKKEEIKETDFDIGPQSPGFYDEKRKISKPNIYIPDGFEEP